MLDSGNHYGGIFFPYAVSGGGNYVFGNYGTSVRLGHIATVGTEAYAIIYAAATGATTVQSTRPGAGFNSGALILQTAGTSGTGQGATGSITIASGIVASTVSSGDSGAVFVQSGNNAVAGSNVGTVTIRTGTATSGAVDGAIILQIGNQPYIHLGTSGIQLGYSNQTPVMLGRSPLTDMEAATKLYVDQAIAAADAGFLRLTGGTMTGAIELLPPINPADAVNKAYVDSEIASLSLLVSTWQVAANIPPLTGQETDGDYYIAVTANPTVPENAPIGTPFPPTVFAETETAELRQLRAALIDSRPDLQQVAKLR